MWILFARQACGRCSSAVPLWSDECPACGLVLHPPGRLRAAGALYLVLGALLTAAPAYLIVRVAGIMARSDDPGAATRFTGTGWQAAGVFGVLGFVLLIGVVGLLMGAWQVVHGRRNLRLVRVAIVLYVVFWTGAMLVQYLG